MTTEELAERLYIVYLRARGGPRMPWDQLGNRIKRGWRAVAQAASRTEMGRAEPTMLPSADRPWTCPECGHIHPPVVMNGMRRR